MHPGQVSSIRHQNYPDSSFFFVPVFISSSGDIFKELVINSHIDMYVTTPLSEEDKGGRPICVIRTESRKFCAPRKDIEDCAEAGCPCCQVVTTGIALHRPDIEWQSIKCTLDSNGRIRNIDVAYVDLEALMDLFVKISMYHTLALSPSFSMKHKLSVKATIHLTAYEF